MSLSIKDGVRLQGLRPEMIVALIVANDVFREMGFDCVVTAGVDGSHSRGSEHYKGDALDFRTRHIATGLHKDIGEKIQARLGKDYDVVMEQNPPHAHLEYDPKDPLTA